MSPTIIFLVKVYNEEQYARKFLNGEMYANPLSYFKKIEGDKGRRDEYEGAIISQREGIILTLKATNQDTGEVNEITITEDDLAAPVIMTPEWFNHINLFCMYAGHADVDTPYTELDLQKQLELPEDCKDLGGHAIVIINVTEFFRRVQTSAHREGYGIIWSLVKYYDPDIRTPAFSSEIETIFNKRDQFAYQKEFRFAIDTATGETKPITLNIGPIDDIAIYMNTSDINQSLTVRSAPSDDQ